MLLDFLKTAINLKKLQRQGWIDKSSIMNTESVADNSYSMAIMGMIISNLETYNSETIIKMILLHDLAESEIGDYTPGEIPIEKKNELENKAFLKILENLPDSIKSQYLSIWKEYQENNSSESQMVHQLDKLEMALQAKTYQTDCHSKEKLESFLASANNDMIKPKLKELFRNIIEDK